MKTQYKDSDFSLNMNEINELLNNAKNFRNKCIIGALYFAGMRRFEVAKMEVKDIDFSKGRIKVIGKGQKLAMIPVGSIFPNYINDLKYYLDGRKEGLLFYSNQQRQMNVSRINQILDETAILAKITNPNPNKKHINPHMLRHSIARHLKNLKFSPEFIQNYMRHSSIKTTFDIYGTLSIDEMEQIGSEKRLLLR